jgi:rhodanese-related sulfurtransferase
VVDVITPSQLAGILRTDRGQILLLDVREPIERAIAAIAPSVHIPMQAVPDRLAELPRNRRIIVLCHHGDRSYAVAGYLESEGFPNVANLSGGIDEWARTVDRSVPRY